MAGKGLLTRISFSRVLLSVILLVISGCGVSSEDRSTGGGDTQGEPGAGTVVSEAPLPNLDPVLRDAASFAKGMTYRSRSGIDDDNTHVTGSVFVPHGGPPEGGFPVVALAPQVVGITALARELGLADRLTFAGARRDIEDVMRALDVFVLTSRHEGFGRVVAEAMATGRPLVVTDEVSRPRSSGTGGSASARPPATTPRSRDR